MMMGPTKKKVISTGIVCFLIPIIIAGALFFMYNKKINEKIAKLEEKSIVTPRYVFSGDKAAGEIITAEDVAVVDVKGESAPVDSFAPEGQFKNLDKIVNRRLIIDAESKTIVTESMLFPEAEEKPATDLRLQEFNMVTLPSDLQVGDFIDFRISLPGGEDYLVSHGKEVKRIGEGTDTNTVVVELGEEDIVRTTAAIIESFMTTGAEVYANKYVKPTVQLYDSKRVDLVELYHQVYDELKKEKLEELNSNNNGNNYIEYNEDGSIQTTTRTNEDNTGSGEVVVTVAEIAAKMGVDEKVAREVISLLGDETNNKDKLALYRSWLMKTPTELENNYPVQQNIAKLIQNNPNILADLKAKYNIEELEKQREDIEKQDLYKYERDYDGTIIGLEETQALNRIGQQIEKKIELQKAERKEYLQSLIISESKSDAK